MLPLTHKLTRTTDPLPSNITSYKYRGHIMKYEKLHQQDAIFLAKAIITACRNEHWNHPLQPRFLELIFSRLIGTNYDFDQGPGVELSTVISTLKEQRIRDELMELIFATELLCIPVSKNLQHIIDIWAPALNYNGDILEVAKDISQQASAKAALSFYHSNYLGNGMRHWPEYKKDTLRWPEYEPLIDRFGNTAHVFTVVDNPEITARWQALEHCPAESFGRAVWQFYQDHNFRFPGTVGGANEVLAQHDWLHVLADYDTNEMGEIEVAAFRSQASEIPGASLSFLGEISIFQGGSLFSVLSGPHPGHAMETDKGVEKVIDALRRGQACNRELYLDMNFFDYANEPLAKIQHEWNILPKAA